MSLPRPEPGLVICYSYLWLHEFRAGREEGSKDRPCAIVLALGAEKDDGIEVVVVPVTHTRPGNLATAMELPPLVKRHLALDAERSWIVLSESNVSLARSRPAPHQRSRGRCSRLRLSAPAPIRRIAPALRRP